MAASATKSQMFDMTTGLFFVQKENLIPIMEN
jgi:hypothetical protein